MSQYRRAAKVDKNQGDIVKTLRGIGGVSVVLGKDDILVGYKGMTFWYEIKSDLAVSRRTGKISESRIKRSQKALRSDYAGHYRIVSTVGEIISEVIHGAAHGKR